MNSEKLKNSILLIIAIVSGFIGGVIGANLSLLFKPNDKLMELVLNWPFLSFVLVIFIVTIFYDSIKQLISKRNWKIKIGDKEISITDYIDNTVDDKLSDFDNQPPEKITDSNIEQIKKIFNIESNDFANIIFHLGSSKYKWRTLKVLSKRTGLDNDKIERYARARPELIIRSIGNKSGNGIYRLNDEKQLLFEEKINKNI